MEEKVCRRGLQSMEGPTLEKGRGGGKSGREELL